LYEDEGLVDPTTFDLDAGVVWSHADQSALVTEALPDGR